ncbi:GNAT family N-acetyltransferase [Stenotrophomonas pigmentata]|uniref:GNAT family N-acetyltransferase n=1 Tax=Stenotrophomonas pigmentata TaxID=3055080 RepID=UPI003869D5D6
MHCFDSGVIVLLGAAAEDALVAALKALAVRLDAQYVGLLNVASDHARQQLAEQGLAVRYLVDRYFMDMTRFEDFDAVIKALPKDGRYEMTRQLRKFAAGSGGISLLSPPFDQRLEQLTELCQQTTARNGTPQYFPAQTLARFVRTCEGLIRLVVVEDQGVVVGGLICFLDGTLMCIWSAGMRYDLTDYSPYTVSFAYAYEWALGAGVRTIEAGRLNARIKTRLGLQPLPLYSATSAVAV